LGRTVGNQNLIQEESKMKLELDNFPRNTSVRDMHVAFHIPYVYDYITKLCRKQAEVIQNHENEHVCYTGQGEAQHRKYKRLKLGGGHVFKCLDYHCNMSY
jgi:hypothetical protein